MSVRVISMFFLNRIENQINRKIHSKRQRFYNYKLKPKHEHIRN